VALAAGAAFYLVTRGRESTDDAQIDGHISNVAARVAGQVVRIVPSDTQVVKAGDLLVELDDRDYAVKLRSAQADLNAAQTTLEATEKQLAVTEATVSANLRQAQGGVVQAGASEATVDAAIEQATADVEVADSRRALAKLDLERSQKLLDDGAVPRAELDARQAAYDQAVASSSQARARLRAAKLGVKNSLGNTEMARGRLVGASAGPAQLEAMRAQVGVARAHVDQAKAALDQAELYKSFTHITAPITGTVSHRTVELGQFVSPDRPLMAIVPLGELWIVANFKEDQVAHLRVGQPARVEVDAFGGPSLAARVDGIGGATGSRFSLLPADNTSGNFTKVVQRIPVVIRLAGPAALALRPGMSASVVVDTRGAEDQP
jgi:membrane fusion protein (multidrug efflux system)